LDDPPERGAAGSNGPPERGAGASRVASGQATSEHWDLMARLDSGHRVFARFLITDDGPGAGFAVAFGHVVLPDGSLRPFDNAKRSGEWEISPDGRRLRIASSILDQRPPRPKFEYDSDRRGIKIHLWYEPQAPLPQPGLADYGIDLLSTAAPARGTLWLKGMAAPLDVAGALALTHTWMQQSEFEIAARRIDFFSLGDGADLHVSELLTPDGRRVRSLVARRPGGGELALDGDRFELSLAPPPGPLDYPVPLALELGGPAVEGSIRLDSELLDEAPFDAVPQPFRFLLSLKARPRRFFADSRFELKLKSGPEGSEAILRGSGITAVTFARPLPRELRGRSEAGA
jgi:hypothetical protein